MKKKRVVLELEPGSISSLLHAAHVSKDPMATVKDIVLDYHISIESVLKLMGRIVWDEGGAQSPSHPLFFIFEHVAELKKRRASQDDADCRGEFAFYATCLSHVWPASGGKVKPVFYSAPNIASSFLWLHPTEHGMVNTISRSVDLFERFNVRWRVYINRSEHGCDLFPLFYDMNENAREGINLHVTVDLTKGSESIHLTKCHVVAADEYGRDFFILLTLGPAYRFVRAFYAQTLQSYPVSLHIQ